MFFNKSLIKRGKIFPVEKILEIARKLGTHPLWLLSSTISNFWHFFYMVITLHNLKILLYLLFLSHPTISNFYQPTNWSLSDCSG